MSRIAPRAVRYQRAQPRPADRPYCTARPTSPALRLRAFEPYRQTRQNNCTCARLIICPCLVGDQIRWLLSQHARFLVHAGFPLPRGSGRAYRTLGPSLRTRTTDASPSPPGDLTLLVSVRRTGHAKGFIIFKAVAFSGGYEDPVVPFHNAEPIKGMVCLRRPALT